MASVPITFATDIFNDDAVWDDDGILMRPDLAPGASEWSRGTSGKIVVLTFVCPCGCGRVGALTVEEGYGGKAWKWNGDELRPTLTPSILKTSPCRWHGYLTDGVFVPC